MSDEQSKTSFYVVICRLCKSQWTTPNPKAVKTCDFCGAEKDALRIVQEEPTKT